MMFGSSTRAVYSAGAFAALTVLLSLPVEIARAANAQDILIIANDKVPPMHVDYDDLRDIFLKRRLSWPAGGRAVPFNAPAGTSLRDDFRKRILGMTESEEIQYWQDRKIRSGVTPPPEMNDTRKAVFRLRGAVSYVYRDQYKEGVAKILLVLNSR